jgi:hypothetical protein
MTQSKLSKMAKEKRIFVKMMMKIWMMKRLKQLRLCLRISRKRKRKEERTRRKRRRDLMLRINQLISQVARSRLKRRTLRVVIVKKLRLLVGLMRTGRVI